MKFWGAGIAFAGVAAALFQTPTAPAPTTVLFLTGNEQGNLAPCGCSFPMMGGAKRRAEAIRRLGYPGHNVILENTALVSGVGRQDEIKFETFAQLHRAIDGAAINFGYSEAKLGPGLATSASGLSGMRLVSSNLSPDNPYGIKAYAEKGPFLIGGLSPRPDDLAASLGEPARSTSEAMQFLIGEAESKGKRLIVMWDGDLAGASQLARSNPRIALIQYRMNGHPPERPAKVGSTWLVTNGDGGKDLVRIGWNGKEFSSYVVIPLAPSFKDEPAATRIYSGYLKRVASEDLLAQVERTNHLKFVGSEKCGSCHASSLKVWKKSKHAKALTTLEHEGHDRDPDCVKCHVTGLDSFSGFVSRHKTPQHSHVGCESCHGANPAHVTNPKKNHYGKAGVKSCMSCHRSENSPKFDFAKYWPRIKHK